MTFKVGDIVELKSGGPLMTVTHLQASEEVYCTWFPSSNAASPAAATFPTAALKAQG